MEGGAASRKWEGRRGGWKESGGPGARMEGCAASRKWEGAPGARMEGKRGAGREDGRGRRGGWKVSFFWAEERAGGMTVAAGRTKVEGRMSHQKIVHVLVFLVV